MLYKLFVEFAFCGLRFEVRRTFILVRTFSGLEFSFSEGVGLVLRIDRFWGYLRFG